MDFQIIASYIYIAVISKDACMESNCKMQISICSYCYIYLKLPGVEYIAMS